MDEKNTVAIPHHAKFRLSGVSENGTYVVRAFGIPHGSTLVLSGIRSDGTLLRQEVASPGGEALVFDLREPDLFAQCLPSPFRIQITEGARQTRPKELPL